MVTCVGRRNPNFFFFFFLGGSFPLNINSISNRSFSIREMDGSGRLHVHLLYLLAWLLSRCYFRSPILIIEVLQMETRRTASNDSSCLVPRINVKADKIHSTLVGDLVF